MGSSTKRGEQETRGKANRPTTQAPTDALMIGRRILADIKSRQANVFPYIIFLPYDGRIGGTTALLQYHQLSLFPSQAPRLELLYSPFNGPITTASWVRELMADSNWAKLNKKSLYDALIGEYRTFSGH